MRGKKKTIGVLALTAVICLLLAGQGGETSKPVRMVQVSRGAVKQIAALTGRLCYQDETLVYAAAPGLVDQLYAAPGQRVAKGEALLRLEAEVQEAAAAAWITGRENEAIPEMLRLQDTVVRAPFDCTVRQVLTAQNAAVTAGMPVLLVSSNQQEIRCIAGQAEAEKLSPGMNAALLADGETVGNAVITSVSGLQAEPETGRLYREVHLLPEQHVPYPAGAVIDVDIYTGGAEAVPVLPLEALTEDGTVWWVHDGICTEIPAEIVLSDEMQAWVNLPEGMMIALGELEEGQRVTEVKP